MTVATIAVSCLLSSCEGRKMSNMVPRGETVEVDPGQTEAEYYYTTDFGGDMEVAPLDSLGASL